jgi:hypothetical protein
MFWEKRLLYSMLWYAGSDDNRGACEAAEKMLE